MFSLIYTSHCNFDNPKPSHRKEKSFRIDHFIKLLLYRTPFFSFKVCIFFGFVTFTVLGSSLNFSFDLELKKNLLEFFTFIFYAVFCSDFNLFLGLFSTWPISSFFGFIGDLTCLFGLLGLELLLLFSSFTNFRHLFITIFTCIDSAVWSLWVPPWIFTSSAPLLVIPKRI